MVFLIDGGRNDHQGISFVTLCIEKILQFQYNPLQGIYKPDLKQFFFLGQLWRIKPLGQKWSKSTKIAVYISV